MEQSDDWVITKYNNLKSSQFYGKLVLQFEAGTVTVIRKEETFKSPKLHQKNWEGQNGTEKGSD